MAANSLQAAPSLRLAVVRARAARRLGYRQMRAPYI